MGSEADSVANSSALTGPISPWRMRIHNQCDVALGRVGQQKLHAGEPTKQGTRANFVALPWLNLDGPRVKQGRHKPPAAKKPLQHEALDLKTNQKDT